MTCSTYLSPSNIVAQIRGSCSMSTQLSEKGKAAREKMARIFEEKIRQTASKLSGFVVQHKYTISRMFDQGGKPSADQGIGFETFTPPVPVEAYQTAKIPTEEYLRSMFDYICGFAKAYVFEISVTLITAAQASQSTEMGMSFNEKQIYC